MRRHYILLPIAALLATLPLIVHGISCGQDLGFHLQSWFDAARQFQHGALYPHWDFSAAWSAGEPRFVFYPPISWMLGALLLGVLHTLHLSLAAAPAIYTFIAFTAAAFTMHHFARHFVSANAALLASALYLANPYMCFNAFERTAYAELLAAAWIPLLFLAVLRERPTVRGVAVPIALLWLTNAPAAVMGCYAFAFLAAFRVLRSFRLSATFIAGALLGLALPAFYLVPAASERRFVQIAMAIIPNMRFQDNFLFGHTADPAHNAVLYTISVLAVILLLLTAAIVLTLFFKNRARPTDPAGPSSRSLTPKEWCVLPHPRDTTENSTYPRTILALVLLTALIAFLLEPLSTPFWNHLPDLAFLQFPWRLLTLLSAVLAFAIALLLDTQPLRSLVRSPRVTLFAAPLLSLGLAFLGSHLYRQPIDPTVLPSSIAAQLRTHHGFAPTDEYTPTDADNDVLRSDDPPYWLTSDPAAFAPATLPNPAIADPNFDGNIPLADTVSAPAPLHLTLDLHAPQTLILNLRDFPNWRIMRDRTQLPPHIERDDGLIAIALPAGPSTIEIAWHHTLDEQLGLALSLLALLLLGLTFRHSRKIESSATAVQSN